MYDSSEWDIHEAVTNALKINRLQEKGLSEEEAAGLVHLTASHDIEVLGKDQETSFFYTYIMIFGLYMALILYGGMVATSVASEKSSRAMELLVTSAKPNALLFGKVLAACLAGLLQLALIFGSAMLFYRLNQSYWGSNSIIASFFRIPGSTLLYMLIFFLLGFLLYAMLYGAVGSTASKVEDINTSSMPITLLFIVGFFIVVFSITGGGRLDSVLMKIASFVPFTSPMAMFARVSMTDVPFWQVGLSLLILALSVVGVGILAARIYRVGVLLYGQPPKIGEILKMMRRRNL
ncbi:MAG: ABC transporter permease [Lachnospiraceae bacterium]|nr:ABC transporter permease [Lachnospiraceae bacterium]